MSGERRLGDVLEESPLAEADALAIALALAEEIARRHRAGSGALGLAPERIRILERGDGTSAAAVDEAPAREAVGEGLGLSRRLYLAPEAICDERIDERADAYALGVFLYQALTGRDPFEGETGAERVAKKLAGEARLPGRRGGEPLPRMLESLILDLMAVEPERRPAVAEAAGVLETLWRSESEVESESKSEAEAETESEAESETEIETEDVAESEAEGSAGAEPETEGRFFADGDRLSSESDLLADDDLYEMIDPGRRRRKTTVLVSASVVGGLFLAGMIAVLSSGEPEEASGPSSAGELAGAKPADPGAMPEGRSPPDENLPAGRRAPSDASTPRAPGSEPGEENDALASGPPDAGALASGDVAAVQPEEPEVRTATRASAPAKRSGKEPAEPVTEPPETAGTDWLTRAKDHRAAGRTAEAYRAYFRAATSGETKTAAAGRLGVAEIALRLRRYREAEKSARRALELGADNRRAWRVIAEATCGLGERAAASAAYQRAGSGSCE